MAAPLVETSATVPGRVATPWETFPTASERHHTGVEPFSATSGRHHTRYAAIIKALNDNIDYVRKHAMAKGSGSDEPEPLPEPDGGGSSDDVTPVTPEVGDMN